MFSAPISQLITVIAQKYRKKGTGQDKMVFRGTVPGRLQPSTTFYHLSTSNCKSVSHKGR